MRCFFPWVEVTRSLRQKIRFQSIFFTYLKNYLILIILFAAIILVALYTVVLKNYQEEVSISNALKLERARAEIDQQFYRMYEIAVKITDDPVLMDYNKGSPTYNLDALNALQRYNSTAAMYEAIVLGFGQTDLDYYYSPKGVYYKGFFSAIYGVKEFAPENIELMIRDLQAPKIFSITSDSVFLGKTPYLIYAYPLSAINLARSGTVFFIINTQEIAEIMGSAFRDIDLTVALFGRDGPLFIRSQGREIQYADLRQVIGEAGQGSRSVAVRIDGNPMLVYASDSAYAGLTYVTAIQQRDFFTRVFYIRNVVLVVVACMVFLGLVLAGLLALQSYWPIRALTSRILPAAAERRTTHIPNEIHLIEQWYQQNQLERDRLTANLDRYAKLARNNLLINLLYESPSEQDLVFIRQTLGLESGAGGCLLVAVQADNAGLIEAHGHASLAEYLYNLGLFFQAALPAGIRSSSSVLASEKMLVLLCSITSGLGKPDLTAALLPAQQEISQRTGFTVTLTIGRVFRDLQDIRNSFEQVASAAKYRMIYGWNALIDVETTPQADNRQRLAPSGSQLLAKYFLKPDPDLVVDEIRAILNDQREQPAPAMFQYAYLSLLNSIKNTYDLHDPDPTISQMLTDAFRYEPETLAEAERRLIELARALCDLIVKEQNAAPDQLMTGILAYLAANYANPDLCLDQIADHFHLSISHLTAYFRSRNNIGVIAYLDNLRLDAARSLLQTTDLQIKQIVRKVGYVDVNNFIRKFRLKEGVTPVQYRRLHQMV